MRLNKNGFTLVELLAVIVILATIIMIAAPNVTSYLDSSRKKAYVLNAKQVIEAISNDVLMNGSKTSYNMEDINKLLDSNHRLTTSPFGQNYSEGSYVRVEKDGNGSYEYSICLTDTGRNGIELTKISELTDDMVKEGNAVECGN